MKKITLILSLIAVISFQAQNSLSDASQSKNLSFKENKGQVSDQFYKPRPDILFSGTDGNLNFYLKKNGISYQINKVTSWQNSESKLNPHLFKGPSETKIPEEILISRVDINWLFSNPSPQIIMGETLQGYENYYGETCPNGAIEVKDYKELVYKNIYQGIDLKWYQKDGRLKYDYYLAKGANYKNIQLEIKGAEKIYVNHEGELIIETSLAKLQEQKPFVTQNSKKLEANWKVRNNIISFEIKDADPFLPMIIDPLVRLWGTYYGGSGNDNAYAVNTDNLANVYITGTTKSIANIATSGAHQTIYGGAGANWGDAFVVKFSPTGVRQWATYYGGAQNDFSNYCAIDSNGDVVMTGGTSTTNSAVMATAGSHLSTAPGNTTTPAFSYPATQDAYVVKFNSSGVRLWGTYYGGSSYEWTYYANINSAGDILICGTTNSSDNNSIATPGCHQQVYGGGILDGFIAKFNSAGTRQWGSYYGGSGTAQWQEDIVWCAFDPNSSDIYFSGDSPSTNAISTPGSHQQIYGGGVTDGVVGKFNSAGVLQWATYYGGTGQDFLGSGCIDNLGNIYLNGTTSSGLGNIIATSGAHQTTLGGGNDGMLVKFNSSGIRQWGTYYGGTGSEWMFNSSMDSSGDIYIGGTTSSSTGTAIASPCGYNSVYNGGSSDAFLAKFSPQGTRIWGTYFGSIFTDESYFCAADIQNNIYITGITYANSGTVMATPGAYQTSYGGGIDSYLEKFDRCFPTSAIDLTPPSNRLVCIGDSAILFATCGNWYATSTDNNLLGTGGTFTTGAIYSDTTFYVEDFGCGSITGTRTAVSLTVVPSPTLNITNSNSIACVGETVSISVSGASSYTWASNTPTISSSLQVTVFLHSTYTVTGEDANGCKNTATILVSPNLCIGIDEVENIHSKIIVYPNPSNESFIIQSDSEVNLILTNDLGQVISTIYLSSDTGFKQTLKDLSPGIYFLKADGAKQIMSQKIIVIR